METREEFFKIYLHNLYIAEIVIWEYKLSSLWVTGQLRATQIAGNCDSVNRGLTVLLSFAFKSQKIIKSGLYRHVDHELTYLRCHHVRKIRRSCNS